MKNGVRSTAWPVAVLGAGNLGSAIARGIVRSGFREPEEVHLTSLEPATLARFADRGHPTGRDNAAAAGAAKILVVSVQPADVKALFAELGSALDPERHTVVSTVAGVPLERLRRFTGPGVPIVRAMPNLGIQTLNSMTCLASEPESEAAVAEVETLFRGMGETVRIGEGQMNAAVALCASGVAFFLRAIRGAVQGGVEIGFHADQATRMAAQVAKGAGDLLLANQEHPEVEIDQVTTPAGCTIAGLNEMERMGFSAALAAGVVAAAARVETLAPSGEQDTGG